MLRNLTTLALVAGLAACASGPSERSVYAPPANPAPPPLDQQDTYRCDSGRTIDALYQSDKATLRFDGQTHRMGIALSGSGARYIGDGLEWWTKGSGPGSLGTLYRHEDDGTAGATLDTCAVPLHP